MDGVVQSVCLPGGDSWGGGGLKVGIQREGGIQAYMKRKRGRQHGISARGWRKLASIPPFRTLLSIPSAGALPREVYCIGVDGAHDKPFVLACVLWGGGGCGEQDQSGQLGPRVGFSSWV